ncbi:hypothetical protein [Mucilaginibacter sp. CSA2-8R]|uniref:hypothetical protein n=1 Tax=Mucilaginibacter sp. CSA2-8R TaxID=3141542 RepID=UPI00315C8592
MFSLLNRVPVKYYLGAVSCALLVFIGLIIFTPQKGNSISVTTIVNAPGAMPKGRALRLSETDTSKVNPYNRLKRDIHDIEQYRYEAAYEGHSLGVEPGTLFYNSLEISLDASTGKEGKALLYRLISRYNTSFQNKLPAQPSSSGALSDQVRKVSDQLLCLQNFAWDIRGGKRLRHTKETLTVLSYYVAQPISQFSLIPNTFSPENKRITSLIEAYNGVQHQRQYLLSHDKQNTVGLSLLHQQLSTLQSTLAEAINNDQLIIDRLLAITISGNNKTYLRLKDSLLTRYVGLVQLKGNSSSTERLLIVGQPRVNENHGPLIRAVVISLAAAIALLTVAIFSSQISLPNQNKRYILHNYVNRIPHIEAVNQIVKGTSVEADSILIKTIANVLRQKVSKKNVFLLTSFTGAFERLSIAAAVANVLPSPGQTVVLVNLDFSGKAAGYDWMELNSVGVKNFIANKILSVDVLPQIILGNTGVSYISLGTLDVNSFEDQQAASVEAPFIGSNPDAYIHHPRLKLLINLLRSKYHYILLHASPLINPADVLPFSNTADHTILLVQEGSLTVSASDRVDAWVKAGNLNDVTLIEV